MIRSATDLDVTARPSTRKVSPLSTSTATPTHILNVHGVGKPVRAFEPNEELLWVTTDQLERVLDAAAGRSDVRLTFDDGNMSDIEIGLPRLLERGLTAEFFVLAGKFGEPGYLTKEDVRTLVDNGMRVGTHGWAHRDWRRLDEAAFPEEFVDALRVLEDVTDRPITRAAIPFGSYDRRVLGHLRRTGMQRVYTSDGGPARSDQWLQPRTSIRHDLTDAWLRTVLNATQPLPLRARRLIARAVKRVR